MAIRDDKERKARQFWTGAVKGRIVKKKKRIVESKRERVRVRFQASGGAVGINRGITSFVLFCINFTLWFKHFVDLHSWLDTSSMKICLIRKGDIFLSGSVNICFFVDYAWFDVK